LPRRWRSARLGDSDGPEADPQAFEQRHQGDRTDMSALQGRSFKVIADLTIGGVPYVYITKETIAIGFECWTCGEQYLIKQWGG
jgi:hypothetical protein